MSATVFSPHPRLVDFRLRVNRRLMVWLAARRQGCAFGLHLDYARFAKAGGD